MYEKTRDVKILRGGGTGCNSLYYSLFSDIYPNKGGSLCRYSGECRVL